MIAVVAISAFGTCLGASAQSTAGLTRAQVRMELIQLEKAGYNPQGPQENYPQDLMAAEQRVSASQSMYGGTPDGTSVAGSKSAGK